MTIRMIWRCDVCGEEKPVFDIEHHFDGWCNDEVQKENNQICASCLCKALTKFEQFVEPGCFATISFHGDVSHWLFNKD